MSSPSSAGTSSIATPGTAAATRQANPEVSNSVIARVPGYALAGGFGLAVACDFTIASESAEFGLPEISIGLLPLIGVHATDQGFVRRTPDTPLAPFRAAAFATGRHGTGDRTRTTG